MLSDPCAGGWGGGWWSAGARGDSSFRSRIMALAARCSCNSLRTLVFPSETPRALSFFRVSTAEPHSLLSANLWAGDDCASSTLGPSSLTPVSPPSVPHAQPSALRRPQWTQELGFRKKGHRWQVWPWRSQSFLPPTSFCFQPWMPGSDRILLELSSPELVLKETEQASGVSITGL